MGKTVNVFAICSLQEVKPLQRLFGGRVLPCGFCMPGGLEALYTGEAVGRDDFGRDLVPSRRDLEAGRSDGCSTLIIDSGWSSARCVRC